MPDNCVLDPNRDCIGSQKAEDVANRVNNLDKKLSDFQSSVSETQQRFGVRIGKLEAANEVKKEQIKNIKEKQADLVNEIAKFQAEQRESFSDLRKEHRESMLELKGSNREILDIVTPIKHKIDEIDSLREDVDELKEKPAQTWEDIKKQGLGWIVGIILAIVAVALGLKNYM